MAQIEADKRSLAQRVVQSAVPTANAATKPLNGSKVDWLRASGIAESDWQYVDYIIQKESGWNPLARNASSGAGGLPQALPYSKTNCAWGDPICQLRWADSYAKARYGSWAGAYQFWLSRNWW